jgi:hypothetical protein
MADTEKHLRFKYPSHKYIDPILAGRLAVLAKDHGMVLSNIYGFRSPQEQVELYKASGGYKDKEGNWTGGDGYASRPGTSWHEFRMAADVSDEWAKKIDKDASTNDQKTLRKYGLYKPLTKGNKTEVFESWHIQPIELLGVSRADRSKWAPEVVITDVKDFQLAFGLAVDGKIGPQTKGKAAEVKALIDEILVYEKPVVARPKYKLQAKNGAHMIEVDPLNLNHAWLRGNNSKPASSLAKEYQNFINCMFFEDVQDTVYRLLIQDGQVLSPIMSYDQYPYKGTFIVYKDGSVEVNTIGKDNVGSLDIDNIHLAFQGFNLNYEANGSASLRLSMRKEGWGQKNDYIYERYCMRGAIGYNYQTGKAVIVKKNTNAAGIRAAIREAGCIDSDNNTIGIGLDSGDSDALVIEGNVVNGSKRNQVSILTFD